MRIGIINDLGMAVESLRRVLLTDPAFSVAWIAKNGQEAVDRCAEDIPDLVLMDLMMPVMDGVEATRRIMRQSPCPILIVTASVTGNSSKVFEAMGAGALDVVATPVLGSFGDPKGGEILLDKIRKIGRLSGMNTIRAKVAEPVVEEKAPAKTSKNKLVVIGCSTGGPNALIQILSVLPKNFPVPIVVIQHMDEKFGEGLAGWMNNQISLTAKVMSDGEFPKPGEVLFPCTNYDAVLTRGMTLTYTKEPQAAFYHPSVDIFFNSVAQCWRGDGTAVLLTGMGADGAQGLLALHNRGFHTIAQDKETSVVFGMPKTAIELGAADTVLPVEKIGEELLKNL